MTRSRGKSCKSIHLYLYIYTHVRSVQITQRSVELAQADSTRFSALEMSAICYEQMVKIGWIPSGGGSPELFEPREESRRGWKDRWKERGETDRAVHRFHGRSRDRSKANLADRIGRTYPLRTRRRRDTLLYAGGSLLTGNEFIV